MASYGINPRSLFKSLLRSCLVLDLYTPREGRSEMLSEEAVTMLKIWARFWNVPEAAQVILYLEVAIEKCKSEAVPVDEVLKTFHVLYNSMKAKGWLPSGESKYLMVILEEMREHFRSQLTKYKEYYPKNKPKGTLDATILLLRMIHRFPLYKKAHPELPDSFRDELRITLSEACITRFQRFKELNTPFDQTDVEAVIDGLTKLAEMVSDEIEQDAEYFQPSFAQ